MKTSNDKGEVTHFQSFTAAMSGTIGLGNRRCCCNFKSGPGAMLWMIVTTFFGMTLKFVVSLGHKYRELFIKMALFLVVQLDIYLRA